MSKQQQQQDDGSPRTSSDVTIDTRAFSHLVSSLEGGEFNQDCTERLTDLVAALCDAAAGRGGTPTATMDIKLHFKLDGGIVHIKSNCTTKLPKEERRKTVMWATPGNNLTARNPDQADLPFRVIDHSGPARTVRDDAGPSTRV